MVTQRFGANSLRPRKLVQKAEQERKPFLTWPESVIVRAFPDSTVLQFESFCSSLSCMSGERSGNDEGDR